MKKVIYCYDKAVKDKLFKKGYKCYLKQSNDNKEVWLFEETDEILKYLNKNNKITQYVLSNQMYF